MHTLLLAPCLRSPPHVHNGMRIFVGKDHGYKAKYKCFSGFRLTGMNSSYLTCNYGEWNGGHPHCKESKFFFKTATYTNAFKYMSAYKIMVIII